MAQDRLWQMDGMRRARGRRTGGSRRARPRSKPIAEARRMSMRRSPRAQEQALVPEERAVMAAFARGVNYFIDTHRNRLPLEFTLLRYDPRPWTISDSHARRPGNVPQLTNSWRCGDC